MPHFFPRNAAQFRDWFPTEEACANYLAKRRWPRGFRCQICGRRDRRPFHLGRRGLWQCRACAHQTSLTARTALHRTRLPLRVWLRAIYLVGAVARFRVRVARSPFGSYASTKEFQTTLGIVTYSTARGIRLRLNDAVTRFDPEGDRLRGQPRIVREVLIALMRPPA